MFDFDQDRELEKAFEPTHAPDAAQKEKLGEELLRAFDENQKAPQKAQRKEPVKKSHILRKVVFGAAIAATIGAAACAAPMDVNVDIGKSVSVSYQATESTPEPPKLVEAIRTAGQFDDIQVRVRRENENIVVQAEVWGEEAADVTFADTLKKSFPALSAATITEKNLAGKVESTLGKKLAHELFNIDLANEKDVEAIRQKILADLAAQGVEGEVNVQVDNVGDGKKKVMIQIKQEGTDCEPPPDEQKQAP